ncbi:MAG: ABC transporter ATP-binding protein [Romboutsia sp.]|nr:ABC transporter ATP-binding protein [Romboutsia sp.]
MLSMQNIVKKYQMGEEELTILKGVNLDVYRNDFISILGPSGSGKSTLMNQLGCLDTPTSGKYILAGKDVSTLNEEELSQIRGDEVGFIFQSFYLLKRLTALENVELSMIYSGIPEKERKIRAKEMLKKVGLEDKQNHLPNQLSGGQQQRVAIARALANNPSILLCDEPTGALDQATGKQIMSLFKQLHEEGSTIIMITHDEKIATNADRIIRILDGNISEDGDINNV